MWINDTRISVVAVAGPPTVGLTMDIRLYVRSSANEEFKHFFTKHQDVCELLDQTKFDPFVFLIAHALAGKKNNQLFGKCPIASVSSYHINKFNFYNIYFVLYIGYICVQRFHTDGRAAAAVGAGCGLLRNYANASFGAAKETASVLAARW